MPSHKQLAIEERRLYDEASPEVRGGEGQCIFVARQTGASSNSVQIRSSLLGAGALADPLWEEIDQRGMRLSTAVGIMREANKRAFLGRGTASENILSMLHERRLEILEGPRKTKFAEIARGEPHRNSRGKVSRKPGTPWGRIRDSVAEVIQQADVGDDERDWMIRVAMTEIEQIIQGLRSRIRAAKQRGMAWPHVRNACTLLSIPIPRQGKPCDLKLAWRHRRSALASSHPDVVGNESGRDYFQAVMEAYDTLMLYNEACERVAVTTKDGAGSKARKEEKVQDDG